MITIKPLTELGAKTHATAKEKGWYDGGDVNVPVKLCLVHSEVSEALECFRNKEPYLHYAENGKPEGIASELADVIIRVCDLAAAMGIDLDEAVDIKMAFNKTRPHLHGGKAC